MEPHFISLLLVVLLAFAVPLLLARLRRVPVVVGEIIAGIIVGPSLLGWVQVGDQTLDLLAEIGFAFLMFLSGLEIDFSVLFAVSSGGKRNRRAEQSPFLPVALTFLITVILGAVVGLLLARRGYIQDPWMMALILSTTSLGIVVPVMKQSRLSSSSYGQAVLLAALLADFLTMFLITVYVAIRSTGLTFNILLIFLLFVPLVLGYQIGMRQLRRPAFRRMLEELADATSQIKVRGAFAMMIIFVVLAEMLGAELILGAFLGGVMASLISEPEDQNVRLKLDAIGFGFFIPLFFIYVGVQFDLKAFLQSPEAWVLLPAMLLAAFAIKLLAALPLKRLFSWRQTLAAGFLFSARLSLIIAASAIGLRLGVITQATNAAIILVAALTAVLAPYLFNVILPPEMVAQERVMLLYGASDLGFQVALELKERGERVLFLETEPETADRIRGQGFEVLHECGELEACLKSMPPVRVQAFLSLSNDDQANLRACRTAHSHGFDHLVSLVSDPIYLPDFRGLGVQTLTPSLYRSSLLAMMARNPAIFSLLTAGMDSRDLREISLLNGRLDNRRLSELNLPGDVLILAIRRSDELIVPHGTTRLRLGDTLTMIGASDAIQQVQYWMEE